MGKPGGFFKKLKSKQKKSASKGSRGTTGASKEDRRAKHNRSVELHAAQRLADSLDAISESSSDAETDSVQSEDDALTRLRKSLGVTNAPPQLDEDVLDEEDEDEEEEGEEEAMEEEFDEDESLEEEAEEALEEDAADEGDFEDGEYDAVEDVDSQDHESDSDGELAFDADMPADADTPALLQQFQLEAGSTKQGLEGVIGSHDLYWRRYVEDTFGAPDDSPWEQIHGQEISLVATKRAERLIKIQSKQFPSKAPLGNKPSFIHPVLWQRWLEFRARESLPALTPEEAEFLAQIESYGDIVDFTRESSASWKPSIVALHLLNHWLKARTVCAANDEVIKLATDEECDATSGDQKRDRGFGTTRLMLCLPFRNAAKSYVELIIKILGVAERNCRNLEKFQGDFSEMEEMADRSFRRRPLEYRRTFEGNIDDCFCVGLHLGLQSLSVYSHVLNSDIIICSPLGLLRRLEKNGDCTVALASIEVLIIDYAQILLMQNWQHVQTLVGMINKQPKETTKGLNDLARVYSWALEGRSGRHRQTVLVSDVSHPLMISLVRSTKSNAGKAMLVRREEPGVLSRVMTPIRQHFLRFDCSSPSTVDEQRFEYFMVLMKTKIYPLIERKVRVILFIPSYFDFVRVHAFLKREYREFFNYISEYSSLRSQRRALGQFSDLEAPLLVMTERFYFFKRYFVKLAEALVFYSPPVFSSFYSHLIGKLDVTPNSSVMTMFCRFDTHELARICGTERSKQLLERENTAFSFVTQ